MYGILFTRDRLSRVHLQVARVEERERVSILLIFDLNSLSLSLELEPLTSSQGLLNL